MIPSWSFHYGQIPPKVGDKFTVTKVEKDILDLDSGTMVTCATMQPEAPLTKEMYWTIRQALENLRAGVEKNQEQGFIHTDYWLPRVDSALAWIEDLKEESNE